MAKGKKTELTENAVSYGRGMKFLVARRESLLNSCSHDITWPELATMRRDKAAQRLRVQLSDHFGIDKHEMLKDAKFAAAIEAIVENCGSHSRDFLLVGNPPQTRKSVMRLSRTSDTRQRYRIDGVRSGRFRSVAPQDSDPVFDTVKFSEVTSRLRRGRGWILTLQNRLRIAVPSETISEAQQLAKMCHRSARTLRRFIRAGLDNSATVPAELRRESVMSILKRKTVQGEVIGMGRRAVRFTVKSVWDYPEMQAREIVATDAEKKKAIRELNTIISASNAILRV